MDACGFERLNEAARETDRDDVFVPGFQTSSGLETDQPRLEERLAFEVREQRLARFVLRLVVTAEHDAVAYAMLQWNAPLPSGLARDRARIWRQVHARGGLNRERAVG